MIQTEGRMQTAHAGDCFFNSPDFIEYHYTPEDFEEGFINDWMHVQSDTLEALLRHLGLPVNTPHPDQASGNHAERHAKNPE